MSFQETLLFKYSNIIQGKFRMPGVILLYIVLIAFKHEVTLIKNQGTEAYPTDQSCLPCCHHISYQTFR